VHEQPLRPYPAGINSLLTLLVGVLMPLDSRVPEAPRIFALLFLVHVVGASAAPVQPSNLPDGFCDDVIVGDFNPATTAINSDIDCTNVVPQTAGPDLCVLRYNNINVPNSIGVSISGSRPLALTAQGNATIQGTIFVSAGSEFAIGSGANGATSAGGGGAGGITSGGPGGHAYSGANGGLPGGVTSNSALRPLRGGEHGGMGNGTAPAAGGSGGGALQLVACGTLTVAATITAPGYGGSGGSGEGGGLPAADGGGGGGSGGALLFEGNDVVVLNNVAANGGGGGGGGTSGLFSVGNAGSNGSLGGTGQGQASGGLPGSSFDAGPGGLGGARAAAAGPGQSAISTYGAGGGGGGAAGRIRINFCASLAADPQLFSPAATTGISCSDLIFRDGFDPP
jgi:hypothetical protein